MGGSRSLLLTGLPPIHRLAPTVIICVLDLTHSARRVVAIGCGCAIRKGLAAMAAPCRDQPSGLHGLLLHGQWGVQCLWVTNLGLQIELYSHYLEDSRTSNLKYDAEKADSLNLQPAWTPSVANTAVSMLTASSLLLMFSKPADSTPGTGLNKTLSHVVQHHPRKTHHCRPRDTARCIDILNCAEPDLYQFMQYSINTCGTTIGENYILAK